MAPGLKKHGYVRICVNLKRLALSGGRITLIFPVIDDVTHKLAKSKVLSKPNATSGFWQGPVDREMTTSFWRYFFTRLLFGINLAPEVFQRIIENILGDDVVCDESD